MIDIGNGGYRESSFGTLKPFAEAPPAVPARAADASWERANLPEKHVEEERAAKQLLGAVAAV